MYEVIWFHRRCHYKTPVIAYNQTTLWNGLSSSNETYRYNGYRLIDTIKTNYDISYEMNKIRLFLAHPNNHQTKKLHRNKSKNGE
ncbi:hypothetical protein DERP_001148 [Dermatophagoides pteronyssinus]|uniref:Uncharacterized protein n=1 Tax=Dermatophagoides pteronyssinus TaxID=6956 RepID=A0ABQ8JE57_DERPT|nr:hypothetical protein DERP_001148 [Dermatophagoides pteronyssinus]